MLRRPRRRRPVAHVAVGTRPGLIEARACRLVVMPEWQGAGIGAVCEAWRTGENRYGLRVPTLFPHEPLGACCGAAALRRDPRWWQVSAQLYGGHKGRSRESIRRSALRAGKSCRRGGYTGYGGHFRAVQRFRYFGERGDASSRAARSSPCVCATPVSPKASGSRPSCLKKAAAWFAQETGSTPRGRSSS